MKTILLFLMIFLSLGSKAQNDTTAIASVSMGWYTAMAVGPKKGIAVDSVGMNHKWYKSNYRKVPEHGLFVDTVIMKSKEQNYYITIFRVIVNRTMVVESSIFRYYADRKMDCDFTVNKEYFKK